MDSGVGFVLGFRLWGLALEAWSNIETYRNRLQQEGVGEQRKARLPKPGLLKRLTRKSCDVLGISIPSPASPFKI